MQLAVAVPFPPVRRINVDPVLGDGVHPPAGNAPARENKRVFAIIINDGQFEVAVERRAGYGFPIHWCIIPRDPGPALI